MAKKVFTYNLSEPLCEATTLKVDVHVADGNLCIDKLGSGEQVLASGMLQYVEDQGIPSHSVTASNGQATLTLKAKSTGRPWLRLPWSACNAATDWQLHLNPLVPSDITAYSGGGNVSLQLTGMSVSRVSAGTGGGNMEVVLPDQAADISVTARTGGGNIAVEVGRGTQGSNMLEAASGAGNVAVHIPSDLAARIYASSGWGKEIVDQRFAAMGDHTYQSADFEYAADKVEITIQSGAGDVIVRTR